MRVSCGNKSFYVRNKWDGQSTPKQSVGASWYVFRKLPEQSNFRIICVTLSLLDKTRVQLSYCVVQVCHRFEQLYQDPSKDLLISTLRFIQRFFGRFNTPLKIKMYRRADKNGIYYVLVYMEHSHIISEISLEVLLFNATSRTFSMSHF